MNLWQPRKPSMSIVQTVWCSSLDVHGLQSTLLETGKRLTLDSGRRKNAAIGCCQSRFFYEHIARREADLYSNFDRTFQEFERSWYTYGITKHYLR